ncbi:MAG: AAA family ATPase [Candidatus Paceibacterota bacterium]|jgi:dephospho-CoA kinase
MDKRFTVIGITGYPASGKDTIADYLASSRDFLTVSGGDVLHIEMAKRGIAANRYNIHDFVEGMRKQMGPGYLAEEISKMIVGNSVISGIRNTKEVEIFKKRFADNFKLIAVGATPEIREKRIAEMNKISDDTYFDQFKAEEENEKNFDPGSYEIDKVSRMADVVIDNNTTREDLFQKVDLFFNSFHPNVME